MKIIAVESTTGTVGIDGDWLMTTPNWLEKENDFKKQYTASISLAITSLLIGKI